MVEMHLATPSYLLAAGQASCMASGVDFLNSGAQNAKSWGAALHGQAAGNFQKISAEVDGYP